MSMLHLIAGLASLYILWRVLWMRSYSRKIKWTISVIVLLFSQHHFITKTFFGTMASPEVPSYVLMLLGWGFGAILITTVLLLISDLIGGIVYVWRRTAGRQLLFSSSLKNGIVVASMLLAIIGVWQAVRVPDVRTIEIAVAHLPKALDGFKLVQLTDLHASRLMQRPWMEAVVNKTNAIHADMIVITGDLVDGTVVARENDVAPLQRLSAPMGVYAIPGNHEYYVEYQPWIDHFKALGLHFLLNDHVRITRDQSSFVLAGITDTVAAQFGDPVPDTVQALAGVSPDDAVILMSHRPSNAKVNADLGVGLQLSGHTHGGQVLGMHFLTKYANNGYVSGLYHVGDMLLYVSNGTGLWNGFPIRLGFSSEITEIILRSPSVQ